MVLMPDGWVYGGTEASWGGRACHLFKTDGRDGKLYLLGGRDYDNSWLLCYDPAAGSLDCLGWPTNTAQCSVICADREGRILMAENLRNSYIYVYEGSR
jgi:hypothetical protein